MTSVSSAGLLVLRDRLRPDAAAAVAGLVELTGAPAVLLTGDGPGPAREVAQQSGIADVRAGLLPAGKLDAVRGLQAAGARVAYVGDGINDAPALAAADVGVAMAHGADLVLETGDVVVLRSELRTLPALVRLSRRAHRVVRQNLTLAGAVVLVLAVLDVLGLLPLTAAVAGHEASTLLVALNGLRLLHPREWDDAPARLSRRVLARYALGCTAAVGLVLLAVQALSRHE